VALALTFSGRSMRRNRPLVMGIVNVTPDSFSDGGLYVGAGAAIAHARRLLTEGADMLDIGGESTRPGATPVSEADEIARILPVVQALRGETRALVSIDTMKPGVMRAAHAAGADIWNDVTALGHAPDSPAVAAALGCGVILMHMQGEPRAMQDNPTYADVVGEVAAVLQARARAAIAAGVAREAIWLDPGIGFGKTLEHNLALLAHLDALTALGHRTVLGVSRKRFLRGIDPLAVEATDRIGGSLAGALVGARAGMDAIRAHDVRETVQALDVWAAVGAAR
jgi:dihydropteroate synthase